MPKFFTLISLSRKLFLPLHGSVDVSQSQILQNVMQMYIYYMPSMTIITYNPY
jgi:hypothetical protein